MSQMQNQDFKPNFNQELDIESIISAPLIAVSKANVIMATGQKSFLLDHCFIKTNDIYEPIMIAMLVTRGAVVPAIPAKAEVLVVKPSAPGVTPVIIGVAGAPAVLGSPATIQNFTTQFSLPLLTIIPLSSLAIEKVTIEFDMEITSVTSKTTEESNESENKITEKRAQLNGRISYDPNQSRGDPNKNQSRSQLMSKLKVNINAGPLPLPAGVLTILDMYTKAIQPLQPDNKLN